MNDISIPWETMEKRMKNRQLSLIEAEECQKAAVCMALFFTENGPEIILQVRSSGLEEQPGDISLPGGMIEQGELPGQAACRELEEELKISNEQYQLISALDIMHTGNLLIYPFLVIVKDYHDTFNASEVAEIFTVPMSFFARKEPEVHEIRLEVREPKDFPFEKIYGGKRTEKVYFYDYNNYCIWGITAKLIHSFMEICRKENILQDILKAIGMKGGQICL